MQWFSCFLTYKSIVAKRRILTVVERPFNGKIASHGPLPFHAIQTLFFSADR